MYADELGIILDEYLIEDFRNPQLLKRHFRDHGKAVGAPDEESYQEMAEAFAKTCRQAGPARSDERLVGYVGEDRWVLFDRKTGWYCTFAPSDRGMERSPLIRTFFKADYNYYISNLAYGSREASEVRFVREFPWNATRLEREKEEKEKIKKQTERKAKGAAKYAKKMANRKK